MFYKNGDLFFGASPERLVSKKNKEISIDALAGTAENNLENKKALILDDKNQQEHAIVVDTIIEKIKPLSSEINLKEQEILELSNIIHLRTPIRAISSNSLVEFSRKYTTP